ncbi:MAG: YdeI/OmpD-associated family protein [Verrucomicrobiota bacterium]
MTHERCCFRATVTKRDFGRMFYTVVFASKKAEREFCLREHPRLRISGKIAGTAYSGAFQPNGGEWYLILSKRFLKEAGVGLGDRVEIELEIADQDEVDVPDDLMAELKRRVEVLEAWEGLTAGRRRGLAYRVATAKRAETRERRILEVIDLVMDLCDSV